MNNFTIKDIEMLSGIKAHTFRIWEQRHGLCFCKRRESQHRYYDNEGLKAVLRIAYLYHRGYKISQIAHLSGNEIINLATANIEENNYDLCIHQLIEANLDYDQLRFEKIIQHAILRFGFEQSIRRVLYPFMEKVGLLWVTEHLIPAQEHFSSSLIQQKILVEIDRLRFVTSANNDVVLIFSPEGEMHEIPLLIASYQFKKQGIKTVYFGANVSLPQLEYYCLHKRVTHFYFHLITNFSNTEPAEYAQSLRLQFPGIKIMVSGPAIKNVTAFPGYVRYVSAVEELIPVFLNM